MAERLLLVEDEPSVAEGVAYALGQEGYEVEIAADGKTALDLFEAREFDLVLLDLMLPGLSGWQLLGAFRKQRPVRVIMLTARAEEADRVAGLEMGADDYVTKPFSVRELVARVRAVLRRELKPTGELEGPGRLSRAGVVLDQARREVTVDGQPVRLSPKEYELLAFLMGQPGRVRSREEILEAVWGTEAYLDERTVDVHIRWLRTKIEADPAHPTRLLTVRGSGYKFAG